MEILRNKKTGKFLESAASVAAMMFFLLITSFACAGSHYLHPGTATTIAKSGEKKSSDTKNIKTEPEFFDLKTAPPNMKITDEKQKAYFNFMLSSINISNGDYKDAITNLKKVMAYDPNSAYLKKRMALLLNETKNPDLAIKYAEESLKINPDDLETKLLLADLYSMKGKTNWQLPSTKKPSPKSRTIRGYE